ncbi:electron transfer flavoprotein subunit alpha/FixB family protein [Kineococcus gynurae]|uniref:Electron transfer flavoprotein subunit alpha/FixB family protein n=1 Tax=Kineococcus gynurae TaxID=452979 RepID=A0ABV5LTM0_9ACTN
MSTILVLLDHLPTEAAGDGPRLRSTSAELLTLARRLPGEVVAAWIGSDAQGGVLDEVTGVLAEQGVASLLRVDVPGLDHGLTAVQVDAVAAAVEETGASLVLARSSFETKELMARLGVRTGAGIVSDVYDVTVDDAGVVVGSKAVLAGSWSTHCAVRAPLALVTLRPHSILPEPAPAPVEVAVHDLHAEASRAAAAVTVLSRNARPTSERPELAEAEVVVVGGRGTNGDFGPVEELADVLGGAVGATRVATDEGWIGHEAQVGQTGVTISPRLYIGAGVSGAVHHRGGMAASVTVVAINEDPDAPIFEFCDYGIVGDLTEVLPALSAEIRARR